MIEGTISVPVPLVGKAIEQFLIVELKRDYDVEPDVQRAFYEKMRAAHP